MKTKLILSLALALSGVLVTSCKGESKTCVEEYMDDGLNENDAQDKCDEELVETVVVLDELKN